MNNIISVVIADDHPIFRKGLREVIGEDDRFVVVGEAGDGHAACDLIRSVRPDIALLDMEMPGLSGLAVADTIARAQLTVDVILLTLHKEQDLFNATIEKGVCGYVLKDDAVSEVIHAMLSVARGEAYYSSALSQFFLNRVRSVSALRAAEPGIEQLTPMELRVLTLVGQEQTSREIGEQLFISVRTVQTHRANICAKLDVRGHHGLFAFALKNREQLSGVPIFRENAA